MAMSDRASAVAESLQALASSSQAQTLSNVIAVGTTAYVLHKGYKMGPKKVVGAIVSSILSAVPGAMGALDAELVQEATKAYNDMFEASTAPGPDGFPAEGIPSKQLMAELLQLKASDVDPSKGKTFAYVYTPFAEEAEKFSKEAQAVFSNCNALNPTAFPSLRKMEVEVVGMCRWMTGNVEGVCGTMTSGGTESILMAVKTAREYARDVMGITEPECIIPVTAHPAFAKAGHYFGVKMVWIDPKADHSADVAAMTAAINGNTCLMVGSAPGYPFGIMDPIEEIAAVAHSRGLLMHVDACYGGFVLPWLEKIGREVPPWDFRVKGVTSLSMDVHKYGFSAKGASCVLYHDRALRKMQYYAISSWPGGLFVSPSMLGTRAGGPIASAWATMRHYGQNGYKDTVSRLMETTDYLYGEISKIKGLKILGKPVMCCMAIETADPNVNIYAVADVMKELGGWNMEMNTEPASLHMTILPPHCNVQEELVRDLTKAVEIVTADPGKYNKEGSAAMYGMVASIPDASIVDKFLTQLFDIVYLPDPRYVAPK